MKFILLHIIVSIFLTLDIERPAAINQFEGTIAVIVHESVETGQIDDDDLLDIYTLRKQSWDDGSRITICDYKGDSQIRSLFYDELETTPTTIKRIWLRAQFTGRSTPPVVVYSTEEMIDLVMNRRGTIGYVPLESVPEDAKIIYLIENGR